jgi:hypothetical protein
MDAFLSVTCKRGVITGGVKPILKGVKVEAAEPKLGDKIKAALADLAVKIFSDRVEGRNAVATLIPIRGNLEHLEADWLGEIDRDAERRIPTEALARRIDSSDDASEFV